MVILCDDVYNTDQITRDDIKHICWNNGGRVKRKNSLTEALNMWDEIPDASKQILSS